MSGEPSDPPFPPVGCQQSTSLILVVVVVGGGALANNNSFSDKDEGCHTQRIVFRRTGVQQRGSKLG